MPQQDEGPKSNLKPWVAPLAVGSVAVIVLGLLAAYANLTVGALIALVGLLGVLVVAYQAARAD